MLAEKQYMQDNALREAMAEAIKTCNFQILETIRNSYHLLVEHIWAIENVKRVIELTCTGVG